MILPHIIYGAGPDALALTVEYSNTVINNLTNISKNADKPEKSKMCTEDNQMSTCDEVYDGSYMPQIMFFIASLISGIGQTLVGTLGTTYLDDNIKKSETASFMSKFFSKPKGWSFVKM